MQVLSGYFVKNHVTSKELTFIEYFSREFFIPFRSLKAIIPYHVVISHKR